MNLSTDQSEINEMTKKLEQFSALVDLFYDGLADKEMFLSELANFERIDWTKESLNAMCASQFSSIIRKIKERNGKKGL